MRALLLAVAFGFILSPGALLRRHAAFLAEQTVVSSSKLWLAQAEEGKHAGSPLQAKWKLDAKARSCELSVVLPEGGWVGVWRNGVLEKAKERWPAAEALLSGACGIFIAATAKAEARGRLEPFLLLQKVDTKVSNLELVEGEVLYALGGAGARAAQYWIGKEDYAARGLRWLDTEGVLWELRMKKGGVLGGAMELWREGQRVLRLLAEK